MDTQLIIILVATAMVIAGTFVLRKVAAGAIKLAGLAVVAFLGRRQDVGAVGYDWMNSEDIQIIVAAAIFGWLGGIALRLFAFREDGFGKHFVVPMVAVGLAYAAALLIKL